MSHAEQPLVPIDVGGIAQPCPAHADVVVQLRERVSRKGIPGALVRLVGAAPKQTDTDNIGLACFADVRGGAYKVAIEARPQFRLPEIPGLTVTEGKREPPFIVEAERLVELELRDEDGNLVDGRRFAVQGEKPVQGTLDKGRAFVDAGTFLFPDFDNDRWVFGEGGEPAKPARAPVAVEQPGPAQVELRDEDGIVVARSLQATDADALVFGVLGASRRELLGPVPLAPVEARVELHDEDGNRIGKPLATLDADAWVAGSFKPLAPAKSAVIAVEPSVQGVVELRDEDGNLAGKGLQATDADAIVFGVLGASHRELLGQVPLAPVEARVELRDEDGNRIGRPLATLDADAWIAGNPGAPPQAQAKPIPLAPPSQPRPPRLFDAEGRPIENPDFTRLDHDSLVFGR